MKTVYLISKNPFKLAAAKRIFDLYSIPLESLSKDYDEIQASNSLEVARHTAFQAAQENNAYVVREDHSFFIKAWNFPGPFMSFFNKNVTPETIIKMMSSFTDRSAYFEVATVLADPQGKTIEHVFQVPAVIEDTVKVADVGIDGIIRLTNDKVVLAECQEEDHFELFSEGYKKICEQLKSLNK